ncbi:MAG: acetylxylan esterase [Armatimonadetes bacterium]|nr:acetylxylan esterase [Armatimonadota bacterium]
MKYHLIIALSLCLASAPAAFSQGEEKKPESKPVSDVFVAPDEAKDMLWNYFDRMTTVQPLNFKSKAEWERRRGEVRQRILRAFGLDPLPERLPLDAKYGDMLDRGDYVLKRVYWQSYPNIYASGWLYLPKTPGKHAAVLSPHGHWPVGHIYKVPQLRSIGLVKKDYVVLAVDAVHNGYKDGQSYGMLPGAGTQTWNNMRGVDLLQSLPEVDPKRIGCTGASGGGTQTALIMMVDDRIAAAVPAVGFVHFRNLVGPIKSREDVMVGCCCYGWDLLPFTDIPEMFSVFAPRPALFLTVKGDWTKEFPTHDFPDIQSIYRLYGAEDRAECEQWDWGHDYNKPMREKMYAFFNKWLKGIDDPTAAVEPDDLKEESEETLKTLNLPGWDYPRRNGSAYFCVQGSYPMYDVYYYYRARFEHKPPTLAGRVEWQKYLASLRTNLADLLGDVPVEGQRVGSAQTVEISGLQAEKLRVRSEAEIQVPALFLKAEGEGRHPVAIVLHPKGKQEVVEQKDEMLKLLTSKGISVLLPDVRTTGELVVSDGKKINQFGYNVELAAYRWGSFLWGRPYVGQALTDIRACIDALERRHDVDPKRVALIGINGAGTDALFVGALEPRISTVCVDSAGWLPDIFGIRRITDLPEIAAAVAPRRLAAGNALGFDFTRQAYRELGVTPRLQLKQGNLAETDIVDAVANALL